MKYYLQMRLKYFNTKKNMIIRQSLQNTYLLEIENRELLVIEIENRAMSLEKIF